MPYQRDTLPDWAREMVMLYESNSASQFVLYGNIHDRFLLDRNEEMVSDSLIDFLTEILMPQFEVIWIYDLGKGLRLGRGEAKVTGCLPLKTGSDWPRAPRPAVDVLSRYAAYFANAGRTTGKPTSVGIIVESAHLVIPNVPDASNHELSAIALLIRHWANDDLLQKHPFVTCLLTENLNDLHPIVANNPRVARIRIPFPTTPELETAITRAAGRFPEALGDYHNRFGALAKELTGITINGLDRLLRMKEYRKEPLTEKDLVEQKRLLVEEECQGLIEFVTPRFNLSDLYGLEKLKNWLRQDLVLWQGGHHKALPMGYLICGPIGTGKTFLIECLAGEAGVPVVKIKNFRDRWVGSSEGNLEKIFRLLQALDRCYVFVDEADQVLGRRETGLQDAGLSGRIYSMIASEMSRPENRGRLIWVLASSRPDLIEADLKRPGRVDFKIPIFPTLKPDEGFALICRLGQRYGLDFGSERPPKIPELMTAGAAEALVMKVYRLVRTKTIAPIDALRDFLGSYRNPVTKEILEGQIRLALREASDLEFIPPEIYERFGDGQSQL